MATFSPPAAVPAVATMPLGESTQVVTAGPWFSSVTSAAFADAAREAMHGGARELLFDLTGVRAVDAAGTAGLALLAEELEARGCELALATSHPGLLAWLDTADIEADMPVFELVEDGLTDLLRRPV